MEMMFLVLIGWKTGTSVIPEKYTKEECVKIANEINSTRYEAICVPAPSSKVCAVSVPNPADPSRNILLHSYCDVLMTGKQ